MVDGQLIPETKTNEHEGKPYEHAMRASRKLRQVEQIENTRAACEAHEGLYKFICFLTEAYDVAKKIMYMTGKNAFLPTSHQIMCCRK